MRVGYHLWVCHVSMRELYTCMCVRGVYGCRMGVSMTELYACMCGGVYECRMGVSMRELYACV